MAKIPQIIFQQSRHGGDIAFQKLIFHLSGVLNKSNKNNMLKNLKPQQVGQLRIVLLPYTLLSTVYSCHQLDMEYQDNLLENRPKYEKFFCEIVNKREYLQSPQGLNSQESSYERMPLPPQERHCNPKNTTRLHIYHKIKKEISESKNIT